MPLIVFLVKFVFIFVVDFKSIFMPFTTLPFFSHPVKQMYFRLKLIYQIKTEYLEPLSRYSVLNDFLLYKYLFVLFAMCNISCYVYTACRCVRKGVCYSATISYDIQPLVSCLKLIIYLNLHVVEFHLHAVEQRVVVGSAGGDLSSA